MKWLLMILLTVLFIGCADSINGPPYNEQLNYAPHRLKLFEDENFGHIEGNDILIQVSEVKQDCFVLKFPNSTVEVPCETDKQQLTLIMYDKYTLIFEYNKENNADIFLQLIQYKR